MLPLPAKISPVVNETFTEYLERCISFCLSQETCRLLTILTLFHNSIVKNNGKTALFLNSQQPIACASFGGSTSTNKHRDRNRKNKACFLIEPFHIYMRFPFELIDAIVDGY